MSKYYTRELLPGEPKRERIRYFTGINEASWRPLDEIIAEARDGLRREHGYADLSVDRIKHSSDGRYLIVLTCHQ